MPTTLKPTRITNIGKPPSDRLLFHLGKRAGYASERAIFRRKHHAGFRGRSNPAAHNSPWDRQKERARNRRAKISRRRNRR